MKNIITLSAIAILGFSSCSKDDIEVTPKLITYHVECPDCIIYINGSLPGAATKPNQLEPFRVQGTWDYSIKNPTERSFSLTVGNYQGIYFNQRAKGSIKSDTNKSVSFFGEIGYTTENSVSRQQTITLDL